MVCSFRLTRLSDVFYGNRISPKNKSTLVLSMQKPYCCPPVPPWALSLFSFQVSSFLHSRCDSTIKMFGIKTQKRTESYSPVKTEESESFLAHSETSSLERHSTKTSARRQSWIATATMIFCTAVLSALFGAWAGRHGIDADAFSIRHVSEYCMSQLQTRTEACTDPLQLQLSAKRT